MDYSIGQLFHNWVHLKVDDMDTINGIHVFWIDRIAKFVQFVAASTVIIDIVGIEKLQTAGERMRTKYSLRLILDKAFQLRKKIQLLRFKKHFQGKLGYAISQTDGVLGIVLSILVVTKFISNYHHPSKSFGIWLIVYFLISVLIVFFWEILANVVSFILFTIPLLIIELIYLQPLGYLLSHKKLKDNVLKLSYFLFVVGTIIDFLLS